MYELEDLRRRFKDDRFASEAAGAVIDAADEGYAKCSLRLGDIHRNANGAVMGGVQFTLADFAFAVASNGGGENVVSLAGQITYTSPVKGMRLIAEAHCKKRGRTTCFYIIDITDELGTAVATATITGFIRG